MNLFGNNLFEKIFSEAWEKFEAPTEPQVIIKKVDCNDIIERLYNKRRYEDCIKLVESVPMYYKEKRCVEYLMKSFISKNDFSSAKAIANIYIQSQTYNADQEIKWCNNIFETINDKEYLEENFSLEVLPCQHPDFENTSNKTKLRFKATEGCKMISSDKIDVGELILLEKPFALVGNAKCANCFADSCFRVICCKCCKVYYCSEQCKTVDSLHHNSYCVFIRNDIDDNTILALYVLNDGLETDWDMLKDIKRFEPRKNFANVLLLSESFKYHINLLNDLAKVSCKIVKIMEGTLWQTIINKITICGIPESGFIKQVGQILLRILIVCNIKSVVTFDDVLGKTTELYASLSFLQTSCQPNTIICQQQNKLMLKALKEIPAGTSISYSNVEMGKTRYSEIFCNPDELSLLYSKFLYSCNCEKGLHTSLDLNNAFIRDTKVSSKMFSLKLKLRITEIMNCLKNKHIQNMHKVLEFLNKIQLDQNNLIFQMIYFEEIERELSSGDKIDKLVEYLPIIMSIDHVHYFKRNHIRLYMLLQSYTSTFLFNSDSSKLLYDTLISYMDFVKQYVYLFYPSKMLFEHGEIMKRFWRFQATGNCVEACKAVEA